MNKIILVDGNNLLFRSFYATSYTGNIMRNSKGFPTNAIYGFINMINKIIDEEKPSFMLVAFDKGKTFRHDKYDDYKAGRAAMPEDLKLQFPVSKEILDAMGIFHYEIDNYEADDIIGTLSRIATEREDFIGTIISSDKDLLQLINDEIDVKLLKQNDHIRMTKEKFREIYETDPIHMIDLKALMGDSSDNIPGVKGIGEKTAIKLISEYGDINNLYEHIDEIKGKTKEKLIDGKESCFMSYDIATIYKEVPIDFELEDTVYKGINEDKLRDMLTELEFHSLLRKYDLTAKEKKIDKEVKNYQIKDIKDFDSSKEFSYYLELNSFNYHNAEVIGLSICDGENIYFIEKDDIINHLDIFTSNTNKFTYDLKKSYVFFKKNYGIEIKNTTFDTMIGCYLLDYTVKDDISFIAQNFSYDIPLYEDFYGTEKRKKEVDSDSLRKVICDKAAFIFDTRVEILKKIEEFNETDLFLDIELPLAYVLSDMELEGITVKREVLDEMGEELKVEIDRLEKEIYFLSGEEFNIMSPKQLGDILFVKLGIKYPKRKSDDKSFSTSKEILDKLVDVHPIINKILEYRAITKLYTTYIEGLKPEIKEDGKVHTIFNQTLTRTGRLSSVSPNLQNIPIRDELGKKIRRAFVALDDSVLLSSDYSQVELRMFAHVSGVEKLKEAFLKDIDIHTKTASDIFHVPLEEVDKNMRRTAKAVNFGILYGISSFGLAEDLHIPVKEAKSFLDNYLETYSGVKEYMEEEKNKAYSNGYVLTIMNRRRNLEELKSKNFIIRSQGERMALNTPIQGSSADILKKAMVDIFNEFNKRNLKSKMLIQVHDELIFNVLNSELDVVREIVRDKMENVYKLSVPLKVDIETGVNWYDAK
ncbi:MAG: DNA polymerase I [Bacilli bacterium]|nr:DNA polymerase I [Bacilli bacterium]